MIKYLIVGVVAYLMYRFWDKTPRKISRPREDQEPDQDAEYEEID